MHPGPRKLACILCSLLLIVAASPGAFGARASDAAPGQGEGLDAGKEDAPRWTALLDDSDPATRRAACEALGKCEAFGVAPLIGALEHPDPELRRIAAEQLQGLRWPHLPVNNGRARMAYGAFGPRALARLSDLRVRDLLLAEVLGEGVPQLVEALLDDELGVRVAVAVTLLRTGPAVDPALQRIDEVRQHWSDLGDTVTVFWIDEVLRAARRPRWWGLMQLSEFRSAQAKEELPDRVDALTRAFRSVGPPDDSHPLEEFESEPRWDAALALIDGGYLALREAAEANRAYSEELVAPGAVLDELEQELARRTGELLIELDRHWGAPSPVTILLAQLGPATLPAMAHDYLRSWRFPIGSPTYRELSFCLNAHGLAALSVYAEGLEHWAPSAGRWVAIDGLMQLGSQALPAVPLILRAWRQARLEDPVQFGSRWQRVYNVEELFEAIGPDAKPLLEASRADPDPYVRALVERALAAIEGA